MRHPDLDAFYTPPWLASLVTEAAGSLAEGALVADFAAGDGSLLEAASNRWGSIHSLAGDIDQRVTAELRRKHPSWRVARCDFLNAKARAGSAALRQARGETDCVLLNPPFSCRGGRLWEADGGLGIAASSRALAFVSVALGYLGPTGILVAIMPAGALHREKDMAAWAAIGQRWQTDVVVVNGKHAFRGCSARTAVVRLSRKPERLPELGVGSTLTLHRRPRLSVALVRGVVPMHEVGAMASHNGVPLVHTKHLRGGMVDSSGARVLPLHRPVRGPAILLPRVGRPDLRKIAVLPSGSTVVLSDCVFALVCDRDSKAHQLRGLLQAQWAAVEAQYGGTCAPNLTVGHLAAALEQIGVRVTVQGSDVKGRELLARRNDALAMNAEY